MKWVALDLPMNWPHGVKTRPEVDQEVCGTPPKEFSADLETLKGELERFSTGSGFSAWPPHSIFGSLTKEEWMRWGYRHMDHHLRQFGV